MGEYHEKWKGRQVTIWKNKSTRGSAFSKQCSVLCHCRPEGHVEQLGEASPSPHRQSAAPRAPVLLGLGTRHSCASLE